MLLQGSGKLVRSISDCEFNYRGFGLLLQPSYDIRKLGSPLVSQDLFFIMKFEIEGTHVVESSVDREVRVASLEEVQRALVIDIVNQDI